MLDATVRKWDSPTTPEYVTNFTWTAEVRSSPRLGNPWGSENLPERIPTNPSRAVPGFDAAIHRLQGGCLLSGDRGSDLRDDHIISWPVLERRTENPCLRGVIPGGLGKSP